MLFEVEQFASINGLLSFYMNYCHMIIGLIGNMINMLALTQSTRPRRNHLAFYLTVSSAVDSLQLLLSMSSSTNEMTINLELTETYHSRFKVLAYIIQSNRTISSAMIVLIAIHHYVSVTYNILQTRKSDIKWALFQTGILITFSFIYNIPNLIFNEIHPTTMNTTLNSTFTYYYSFVVHSVFGGILPVIICLGLSISAYCSIRRIIIRHISKTRQRLAIQLSAMILLRAILFIVTTVPYNCFQIYQIHNSSISANTDLNIITDSISSILRTIRNMNYSVCIFKMSIY